jgi:hypothetical protein
MFNPFRLLDPQPKQAKDDVPFAGFQRDPLDAVPVRNTLAEHREDSRSCCQIRLRLEPKPGLGGRVIKRFGLHRDVRVDLDPCGSYFWSQIDGSQSLRAIERKIRNKFALNPEESRNATIMFTKTLMLRHLIQLNIEN